MGMRSRMICRKRDSVNVEFSLLLYIYSSSRLYAIRLPLRSSSMPSISSKRNADVILLDRGGTKPVHQWENHALPRQK